MPPKEPMAHAAALAINFNFVVIARKIEKSFRGHKPLFGARQIFFGTHPHGI